MIPGVGLGTWQSAPGKVELAVKAALKAGYRHIDTYVASLNLDSGRELLKINRAYAYQNEKEVGQGIRDSGVPRSEIFLATKLTNHHHHRATEAIDESLENLGVDYVDLYLVHWPVPITPGQSRKVLEGWDIVKTWYVLAQQ